MQQVLRWVRSHRTEAIAILATVIVLVVIVVLASSQGSPDEAPSEDKTSWLSWQSTSVRMPDGNADLFWVQLAQEQQIELRFQLKPSTAEVSVVVGTIRNPNSPNWSWGYREQEFARVADGDTVVFEAGHTYDYGIWMKPRVNRTVNAFIDYRFST